MKWIKRWFHNQKEALVARIAHAVAVEITWSLLADLGVAELERILEQAKKNREAEGNHNYRSLAELYVQIMRERRQ